MTTATLAVVLRRHVKIGQRVLPPGTPVILPLYDAVDLIGRRAASEAIRRDGMAFLANHYLYRGS